MDMVPWGGSEELWSRAATHLAREHHVSASTVHWPQQPAGILRLEKAGVDIFHRRQKSRSFLRRVVHKLKNGPADRAVLGEAAQWLEKLNPDLVCLSLANCRTGLMWLNLVIRLGLPFVIVVHGVYETLWPEDSLAKELRCFYQAASTCFFVSNRNRELFEMMIGLPLSNAEIVRNPFNVRYEADPAWPSSEENWNLAMVGRLEPLTKGQDILFRAISQNKWKSRNVRFTCYGSGPHYGECVRKLAANYAPDLVEFAGHQNDVEAIWASNHAVVMPSRCEGMPLSLVEAMLCGRPAIVTDVAGHTELVEHGVNGFVAKAPTVELFDEALEEAWQNRHSWQKMGRSAREKARSAFGPEPEKDFAARLLEIAGG